MVYRAVVRTIAARQRGTMCRLSLVSQVTDMAPRWVQLSTDHGSINMQLLSELTLKA